jgi:hypothetical protein
VKKRDIHNAKVMREIVSMANGVTSLSDNIKTQFNTKAPLLSTQPFNQNISSYPPPPSSSFSSSSSFSYSSSLNGVSNVSQSPVPLASTSVPDTPLTAFIFQSTQKLQLSPRTANRIAMLNRNVYTYFSSAQNTQKAQTERTKSVSYNIPHTSRTQYSLLTSQFPSTRKPVSTSPSPSPSYSHISDETTPIKIISSSSSTSASFPSMNISSDISSPSSTLRVEQLPSHHPLQTVMNNLPNPDLTSFSTRHADSNQTPVSLVDEIDENKKNEEILMPSSSSSSSSSVFLMGHGNNNNNGTGGNREDMRLLSTSRNLDDEKGSFLFLLYSCKHYAMEINLFL